MQITRDISKGQVVALTFGKANCATGTVEMFYDFASEKYVTTPFNGCLVGIAVNTSAASTGTSSTATFAASMSRNSTAVSGASKSIYYTTQHDYGKFNRDTYRFVAGDELGVKYTAAATWGPNTIDVAVTLFVIFDLEGV